MQNTFRSLFLERGVVSSPSLPSPMDSMDFTFPKYSQKSWTGFERTNSHAQSLDLGDPQGGQRALLSNPWWAYYLYLEWSLGCRLSRSYSSKPSTQGPSTRSDMKVADLIIDNPRHWDVAWARNTFFFHWCWFDFEYSLFKFCSYYFISNTSQFVQAY